MSLAGVADPEPAVSHPHSLYLYYLICCGKCQVFSSRGLILLLRHAISLGLPQPPKYLRVNLFYDITSWYSYLKCFGSVCSLHHPSDLWFNRNRSWSLRLSTASQSFRNIVWFRFPQLPIQSSRLRPFAGFKGPRWGVYIPI